MEVLAIVLIIGTLRYFGFFFLLPLQESSEPFQGYFFDSIHSATCFATQQLCK
jgi:hypothetical protein